METSRNVARVSAQLIRTSVENLTAIAEELDNVAVMPPAPDPDTARLDWVLAHIFVDVEVVELVPGFHVGVKPTRESIDEARATTIPPRPAHG